MSSEASVAGLRRWIAQTEAEHAEHGPDRPIRYRFFIYEGSVANLAKGRSVIRGFLFTS